MKRLTNKRIRRAAKRLKVALLRLDQFWRNARERSLEELQQAEDERYCLNTYNEGLWASLKEEEEIAEAIAAKYDDRREYDYAAGLRL